jgi:hypothetical protein
MIESERGGEQLGEKRMLKRILGTGSVALLMTGAGIGQEKNALEKKALTPEAFLELRSLQDPQFSPDGTRVAFVVNEPRTSEKRLRHIWIYEKNKNASRQLTYSGKSESSPRWLPFVNAAASPPSIRRI